MTPEQIKEVEDAFDREYAKNPRQFDGIVEEVAKYRDLFPKDYKVPGEWRGITLGDIDAQWKLSKDAHPSFGQQLSHFAAGIDRTLKERNHD